MKQDLSALIAGLLFGFGLALSGMVDPARVAGFLDLFRVWDPTLALVMGGALLVTVPGFWLIERREKPLLAASFELPTRQSVDLPLISGAVLFGLGWGLAGLCPGPALAGLVSLKPELFYFVAVMLFAWWATDLLIRLNRRPTTP